MGVIAVPRELVSEWVLPAPLVTSGEAVVALEGDSAQTVAGLAPAQATITGQCFVTVTVLGAGVVAGEGDTFIFPGLVGDAEIPADGVSETSLPHITSGIAYAEPQGLCGIEVAGECVAGVVVVTAAPTVAPQFGSADIEIEYYGDGDVPIFPFGLPALFMEIDFSNLDAAALVNVSAVMDGVVAVIGGEAAAAFDGRVAASSGLPGGTVDSDGQALVNIVGTSVAEFASDAVALAVVDAVSQSFYSSILPTRLPFVFLE